MPPLNIPPSEAETRYGKSASHLRLLLRNGVISGHKLGRDWVITETDETMRAKLMALHPGAPKGNNNATGGQPRPKHE